MLFRVENELYSEPTMKGNIMKLLMHIILTFLTGGLWLMFLLIKFLTK